MEVLTYSLWSSVGSSEWVHTKVACGPDGTVTLKCERDGAYLKGPIVDLIKACLYGVPAGCIGTHPLQTWAGAISLPGSGVVSSGVSSSDGASQVTCAIGNSGELTVAGNGSGSLTLTVDAKLALTAIMRVGVRALATSGSTTAIEFQTMYDALKGAWWE